MGDYNGRLCSLGEQAIKVARGATLAFPPLGTALGISDGLHALSDKIPHVPDPDCRMPPKTCEDAGKPAAVKACQMRLAKPVFP